MQMSAKGNRSGKITLRSRKRRGGAWSRREAPRFEPTRNGDEPLGPADCGSEPHAANGSRPALDVFERAVMRERGKVSARTVERAGWTRVGARGGGRGPCWLLGGPSSQDRPGF